jgi:hypothetical protein
LRLTIVVSSRFAQLSVLDADGAEFLTEVGIATIEKIDAVDEAFADRRGCSDHVGETSPEVGYDQLSAVKLRGAHDDCRVAVISGTESTASWPEAFGEYLYLGAKAAQSIGVAQAVLVDSFVHDADAIGLGESSDER